MTRRDFRAERSRFEQAVGAAILAIGELEYLTVCSIALLEDMRPQEIWKVRRLDERVKRLRAAVASAPTAHDSKLLALAADMARLGKRRHEIAHNPIHYQIYEDMGFDKFVIETPLDKLLTVVEIEVSANDAAASVRSFGFDTITGLGKELGRF